MLTFFDGTRPPPAAGTTLEMTRGRLSAMGLHRVCGFLHVSGGPRQTVLLPAQDSYDGGEASYREQARQIAQRIGL